MGERAMRPFWIHQMAEYIIGIAIVSQGLQDPDPLIPSAVGTLVILNAAIARGPLGAFRWVGRRLHRWFDIVLIGLIAFTALQPWVEISATGRGLMLVMLLPLGFLWFYTDWAERAARTQRRASAAGPTGDQIGRSAGRLAGTGYAAAKQAIKKRSEQS